MRVEWKQILLHSRDGSPYFGNPFGWRMSHYQAALGLIAAQKEGKPISLKEAAALFHEDLNETFGSGNGIFNDIAKIGLVRWINEKGFKIILDGSEYSVIP